MPSPSNGEDQPIRPGSIIDDRFRVEAIIGEGGMGVVVRAIHLKLGSQVALKFLQPAALAEPVVVERFTREARAAARLTSDHVARITDVGSLKNGAPFMVMEYLTGETLGALLRRRGALPIGEACHYMIQVCDGLAEAHSSGIVHRDLKPANLFLASKPNGKTVVKILDFGISKIEEGLGVDPELTTATTLLGTPNYMAPEQLISAKTVDARADIWSCGVCLHRMLSGSVPFDADSIIQLSVKLMNEEPPDLSVLRSDIPAGLAAIVRKCLEREPPLRWSTTNDLGRALEPYATFESARLPPLNATAALGVETIHQPFPSRVGSSRPPPMNPPSPPDDAFAETQDLYGAQASAPALGNPNFGSAPPAPLRPSHTPLAGPMDSVPPPPESTRSPARMGLGILGGIVAAGAILIVGFITRSTLLSSSSTSSGRTTPPQPSSSAPAASTPPAAPTSPPIASTTAATTVPPTPSTTAAPPTPPVAPTAAPTPHGPKLRPFPSPLKKPAAPPSKPTSNNNNPIPDER